jgi:mannose-6-phosphate isomerase
MGLKRVLLSSKESGCSISQVAVIELKAGERSAQHIHPDLQDLFFILEGEIEITIDGEVNHCVAEDFVFVEHLHTYELHAITDVRMLAMGCVIEAQRTKLYPMLLEPNLHTKVWGSTGLTQWKNLPEQDHIGESWEVSAVPESPSVIANGTWAGYTLIDVVEKMPEAILGKAVAKNHHNKLPILVKLIDTNDDLSVQVHPDDALAQEVHGEHGKTEMWYVIAAQPGACIYAGFQEQLTPESYAQKVADGTILDSIAKHEVHAGDVFYLPAGRIHAIGKGVLLAEVQQTSDITYRIYDYGRPGLDGKPRELHTELAAQALDFTVHQNYRNTYKDTMDMANLCLDTDHFSVRVLPLNYPMRRNMILYDSFVIITCVHSSCLIHIRSTQDEIELQEGFSCFIPAAIADYDIVPLVGDVKVLEAYINNRPRTTWQRIVSQFMHLSGYDI